MTSQTTAASAQQTAAQTVRDHHERLVRTLNDHAVTIRRTVDRLSAPAAVQKKLVAFCADEVLPHAAAEEEALYKAAAELPEARLLVQAMRREHVALRELVAEVEWRGRRGRPRPRPERSTRCSAPMLRRRMTFFSPCSSTPVSI